MYTAQDEVRSSTRPLLVIPLAPIGTIVPMMINEKEELHWTITRWEYQAPPDPFALTFGQFLQLSYAEATDLQDEVYKRFSSSLEDAWKAGKRQVVICDGQIIYTTEALEDIPNETVMALAKERNKACYVFSAPDIVEESAWTPIAEYDPYPTIPLYLGEEESDESKIDDTTLFAKINSDFDTGTPSLKAFPAQRLVTSLKSFAPPLRETEHLGKKYKFFVKRAKICSRSVSNKIHSTTGDIRIIEEWNNSALLQASPNRSGIVGRSLIRDLKVKLELDPLANITRVHETSAQLA